MKWVDQNGSTIDYLADKRFSVSSGFLTITGVKSADANIVFTCEATNEILTVKSCAAKITRVFGKLHSLQLQPIERLTDW